MRSILISSIVFAAVFSGGLAGLALARLLAGNVLGSDATKDIIRLATGLLMTMTALVLGMLVSSANSSYQDRKNELAEMASDFVVLDQVLATYGPETQVIRDELRQLAENSIERIWPSRPNANDQTWHCHYRQLPPEGRAHKIVRRVELGSRRLA